jgi:lysophospholipase L1-like esterase
MKIALLGDSDVARWPVSDYPKAVVNVSGQSGATLSRILVPHNVLQADVVIVCAGENDIATDTPLWKSEQALRNLLQQLLVTKSSLQRVFFLGPKFEPWMQDDREMRKKYWQMHVSFQRILSTEEPFSTRVHYIDSLFLFCTDESGDQLQKKGAVFKATPNPLYFHADQLHLSREGYFVWKELLEQQLAQLGQGKE